MPKAATTGDSKGRANPIPGTIQTIPGYPSKLKIFQVPCSRYWWARVYVNGRYSVQSLKTETLKEAQQKAKKFYESVLVKAHLGTGKQLKSRTFAAVGGAFISTQDVPDKQRRYLDDKQRFDKELLPFFGEKDIGEIHNADLHSLIKRLQHQGLSGATINHYMIILRKILKYAADNRLIAGIPNFPRISGRTRVTNRDYFEQDEYETLVETIETMATNEVKVRGVTVTLEFKYLVQFMVNSFIRPSDLRVLKNHHVHIRINEAEKHKGSRYFLLLKHPAAKTTDQEVITMPAAHGVYKKLIELQTARGYGKPDDYVFFPEYDSRNAMMAIAGRMFREAVKTADLEEEGLKHTLYSLRHTSIMYRLLKGNTNTLELAKNARTSQAMIDKHYASRLTPLMAVQSLHSFRSQP